MQKTYLMAAALSVLLFSACAPMNRAQMGGAGGAAAGAIAGQAIGHNTGATLIGAAVGGMLGYIVGNEMDKFDQQQLSRAYETAPSGQPVAWTNPDSHKQYQVIPEPAYTGSNNQTCRDAEIVAVIDGRTKQIHSTACRDAYGTWQLQQ